MLDVKVFIVSIAYLSSYIYITSFHMTDSISIDDLVFNFSRESMILAQHDMHSEVKSCRITNQSITGIRESFRLLIIK